jgi:uncharacterized membrane protein
LNWRTFAFGSAIFAALTAIFGKVGVNELNSDLAPASRVAPIDKLSVVFVVIFAVAFLGEPLSWKVGIGAAFIAMGALIMAI